MCVCWLLGPRRTGGLWQLIGAGRKVETLHSRRKALLGVLLPKVLLRLQKVMTKLRINLRALSFL